MDNNSSLDRLFRLLKTSSTASGLAGRIAMEKIFKIPINDDVYADKLLQKLGNLKGPIMKLAQFLATVPGALPDEYSQAFLELQSDAPAMGIPFVKKRLQTELGKNWQSHFKQFDLKAKNAASLGQVHQATLTNGDLVAVKLQYPSMDNILESDLGQLSTVLKLYQSFNKAINTGEIEKELRERLFEELDYLQEEKNLQEYKDIFKGNPNIIVPTTYPELSTKRLLTMSWHNGDKILTYTEASSEVRHQIAENLFHAWYYPFYRHNVIHGDPHPGNYLITDDLKIVILDFGCVRRFDTTFIDGVILLYQSLLHNRREDAVRAYVLWGFKNLNNEQIDIITDWAKLLYEPLLNDCVRPIQKDSKGQQGLETALKVHEALNKTGGITPPQSFVFMDRAAVGIGAIMMRLNVSLNWHKMFEELIAKRKPLSSETTESIS